MKKYRNLIPVALILVLNLSFLASCKDDDLTKTLSAEEKNDLLRLREEEKLARDVYLFAYDKYQEQTFKNISNSEQKHMDKVLDILTEYGVADPASSEKGVFKNSILQELYNSLTAKADSSLIDALIVGATVEDVDIYDINDFIANTQQAKILDMYEQLNCGSRNHLRAYYSKITENDSTYIPQYISITEFNSIINADHESCGNNN